MRCSVLLLLVSLYMPGAAQQISFTASANARQVTPQTPFQVTFTLENARGTEFQAPQFSDVDMATGPSVSQSTSIINGVATSSQSYTYSLMKTKPGVVRIGPASIRVGREKYTTGTITVEVVAAKSGTGAGDAAQDLILRAVVTDQPVYPGQQVRLDYKVYTTVNVRNYNAMQEDDYAQFYYRYIQDFRNKSRLEVVNGVQYTAQTIKSLALFPQQTGTFRLIPMVATLGVQMAGSRPDFFFGVRTTPVTVSSDSIRIRVLPLPAGAPESFTGAVGTYQMQAQINKTELTTDDALVLTLSVSGDGDPRRWSPPQLGHLAGDFEIYDPKVLQDDAVDEMGAIRHRRVLEYLLIPRRTGVQTLRAHFAYFDPVNTAYQTLSSPEFQIRVAQGMRSARGEQVYRATENDRELRGLKTVHGSGTGVFLFTPVYFILMALPLAGLGILWWTKRRERLFEALDPVEKKRRRARTIAKRYLTEAQQALYGGERQFYDSISRAIFSYVSAKCNVPASELSKSSVSAHLVQLGITDTLREETMQILVASEQVLYAGGSIQADRQKLFERTLSLIEEAESHQPESAGNQ